eukprot:SAG31_NODE_870_length_11338_cov_14.525047_2_plen_45_part_00
MDACVKDSSSDYAFDIGTISDCNLCNAVIDGWCSQLFLQTPALL